MDEAAALEAQEAAKKALANQSSDIDYSRAAIQLAEASAQLRTLQSTRKKVGRNRKPLHTQSVLKKGSEAALYSIAALERLGRATRSKPDPKHEPPIDLLPLQETTPYRFH